MLRRLLLCLFIAFPLHAADAGIRGSLRAGVFIGAGNAFTGTAEVELRSGHWALAPTFEGFNTVGQSGAQITVWHIDARYIHEIGGHDVWIGAGPTWVGNSDEGGPQKTWNADIGMTFTKHRWQPFVAARYYRFNMPIFRDVLKGDGAVISIGISTPTWPSR